METEPILPIPPLTGHPIPPLEQGPPAPVPLLRERAKATAIPLDSLGPLSAATTAIATLTQAPAAIAMQSVLGAASLGVQAHADVETLAGTSPTSLYLLTVAQSGERKSSCDKLALAAVREFEHEALRSHRAGMRRFERAREIYDAQEKALLRASDAVSRDADLEALGPPPTRPLTPICIAPDPTWEGLLRLLGEGRPSVGVVSDEGGQLFAGHAMSAEHKIKTIGGLSKLWDGATVTRVRAGSDIETFPGRRCALHQMVQPRIAERVLGDPDLGDQGFLARCLLSCPESRIGYREPASGAAVAAAAEALDRFAARLGHLIARAPATTEDPRELAPRRLRLAPNALALLGGFGFEVEHAQRPNGPLAAIRPTASKAPEQAARIAGVLTLFADPDAAEILPATMADAITLTGWYLNEAIRLLDTGVVGDQTRDAETLRVWLVDHWPEDEIDSRTIVRRGPNRLRDTKRIKEIVRTLEEYHWLEPVTRGRQKTWRIARP